MGIKNIFGGLAALALVASYGCSEKEKAQDTLPACPAVQKDLPLCKKDQPLEDVLNLTGEGQQIGMEWLYSIQEGKIKAAEESKNVMVYFHKKGCHACSSMESKTFKDQRVIGLSYNFVCVYSKEAQDEEEFNIFFFPTVVFLDKSGKEIARAIGYNSPDLFAKMMEENLDAK